MVFSMIDRVAILCEHLAFMRCTSTKFGRVISSLVLLAMFLIMGGLECWADDKDHTFDFGPIASKRRDVFGNYRVRALGPFCETVHTTNGVPIRSGFYPLCCRTVSYRQDIIYKDYLWPIASSQTFEEEVKWRFLITYGRRNLSYEMQTNAYMKDAALGSVSSINTNTSYRVRILPFYFQGRDGTGSTYRAVFPLGGTIRDFLVYDEVHFFLFPLLGGSSCHGQKSKFCLWPVLSRTEGCGNYRHRAFPFYAYAEHTNDYRKVTVLWPIYNYARYLEPGRRGYDLILWPLFGRVNMENQKGWMFLPPFFRFQYSKNSKVILCPWPFYQRRTGDVNKLYIWPLWGRRDIGKLHRMFVLWPFIWSYNSERPHATDNAFLFLPFIISEVVKAKPEPGAPTNVPPRILRSYFKLWPLMLIRQDGDLKRFRFLELSPLRDYGTGSGIERCWAPLWSIVAYSGTSKASNLEILWGLCRYETVGTNNYYFSLFPLISFEKKNDGPETRKGWSVLKGLVSYANCGNKSHLRLLYFIRIPLSKGEPASKPSPQGPSGHKEEKKL